jgi:hypothetical protein
LIDFIDGQQGIFGLTDSYAHQYHIQSYFFGVGTDIESRDLLLDYFLNLNPAADKAEAITRGELALSAKMAEHDIPCSVLCPYDRVLNAWLADLQAHVRVISDLVPLGGEQLLNDLSSNYEQIVRDLSNGLAKNPCHLFWHTLVRTFRHPFIKRELLFKNPTLVPDQVLIMRYISENCSDTYRQALALAKASSGTRFPVIL